MKILKYYVTKSRETKIYKEMQMLLCYYSCNNSIITYVLRHLPLRKLLCYSRLQNLKNKCGQIDIYKHIMKYPIHFTLLFKHHFGE